MNFITSKIIEINKNEIQYIKAVKGDVKSRFINFKFVANNTVLDLTGCTVRVYAEISDKTVFNDLSILDARQGIAQLELTNTMLANPGIFNYQIKIFGGNNACLSSNILALEILESLFKDDAIVASNEFTALEIALGKIDNYTQDLAGKSNFIDSLEYLKTKKNIKKGQVYKTLGFYKKNDRGGAIYYITDRANLTTDEMFIVTMQNNLVAILLYENIIYAEQLGFKESYKDNQIFDNATLLNKFYAYMSSKKVVLTLKFGSGWYGFSPVSLYYNWGSGLNIEGLMGMNTMYPDKTNQSKKMFGTTFFPILENQEYILQVTAPVQEFNLPMGVNISNICFWGGLPSIINGVFNTNANTDGCKCMLDLARVTFGNFTNLQFVAGTAVIKALNWCGYECQFDNLMFRDLGKFGVLESAFYAHDNTGSADYVVPSGGYGTRVAFENIPASWIKIDGAVEFQFTVISGETSDFSRLGYTANLIATDDKTIDDCTEVPLFIVNNAFGALQFNNITAQHNSRFKFINNTTKYIFNTIFKNDTETATNQQLEVNTVTLQGNRGNIKMLDFTDKNEALYTQIASYSFRNICLSNTFEEVVDVIYNVPKYILLDIDRAIYNTQIRKNMCIDWLEKNLTWKDSIYPARTIWDNTYQMNKMLAYPSTKVKFPEPYYIFKCTTENLLNETDLNLNILAKRSGTEQQILIAWIYYEDGTSTNVYVGINSDFPKNYFAKIHVLSKKITSICLQQQGSIIEGKQIEVYRLKFSI